MTLLLDTNIIIDHLNGVPEATAYLKAVHGSAAISVVTRAEVLAGIDGAENEAKTKRLLGLFPALALTPEVADEVASFRKKRLKFPDAAQAALATIHKLQLVTRDTRDFSTEKLGLRITVPYTLRQHAL
jgi:predicted nucleic acid-binding protein